MRSDISSTHTPVVSMSNLCLSCCRTSLPVSWYTALRTRSSCMRLWRSQSLQCQQSLNV